MAPTTTMRTSARKLQVILALLLVCTATIGCSKQDDTKDTHLSQANAYFAAGQYSKAEKEFRDVLRLDPADPVALRRLGIIYSDQGQLPQAYPLLKKAVELQPDDADLQVKFGQNLLVQQEYQQARQAALTALDKQPGREEALVLLATTAMGLDDVEDTQKLIETLRAKDQDRSGYHLALGILAQKDQVRAEAEYKNALKLDPNSAGAYTALANLYWSRNDLKGAEQCFKAAADLARVPAPARLRYADFKLRTGTTPEAKKILENLLDQSPDYLPASVALMRMSCSEHHDADCGARVQAILARDTMNYDALFQDGILNIEKGDAAKAVREFEYLSGLYFK